MLLSGFLNTRQHDVEHDPFPRETPDTGPSTVPAGYPREGILQREAERGAEAPRDRAATPTPREVSRRGRVPGESTPTEFEHRQG